MGLVNARVSRDDEVGPDYYLLLGGDLNTHVSTSYSHMVTGLTTYPFRY